MHPRQLISAALLAMSLMVAPACTDPNPGPDPGPTDTGPTPLPTDPNDPNNAAKDTDCDGLSDKLEFEASYEGSKTHPGLTDTDQDGLPDGLEVGVLKAVTGTSCTVTPDADATMQTSPVRADTDGDGLLDGVEDKNHNGKVDDDETHPLLLDTDCDGLRDGPTTSSVKGEDQDASGSREASETDPRLFDTDGDGISDGVESGATTNLDESNCKDIFRPDVNPGTTTDATNPDSDGDGVSDGAEDNNQNGGLDEGELDPRTSDATGPAGQVCTTSNLRPVTFQSEEGPDIKLALPPTFTEVTQIMSGTDVKGLVGYDSTTKTAFLAFRATPPAGSTTALGDEEELQPAIAAKGALSNRTAQVFKTWEGFEAVQAFYDQAGTTTDLKRRADQLVDALVPGSTGRLSSAAAGVTGNFRLQTLFVHRSNQSLVVVIAIAPLAGVTGANRSTPAAFSVKDLSDGSALAQFGEPTAAQCERFQLPVSKVDFLFVVDDSGSMKTSQLSLAAAAQSAADSLNASSLDWRMAMVTSAYHLGNSTTSNNVSKLRRFTRNVSKVKSWLTESSTCSNGTCTLPTAPETAACPGGSTEGVNGGCWVGLSGNGSEGVLGAARKAIDDMTPGTDVGATESPTLARKDATIVVVLLGDADDQTTGDTTSAENCGTGGSKDKAGSQCVAVANYVKFFGNRSEVTPPENETGRQITVHGIVCPAGKACGCSENVTCTTTETSREFNPLPANGGQRHAAVVNATGGVLGSILDTASIGASMDAIITDTIGNAGYKTLKPPIGASIKVAMENVREPTVCTQSGNIPRSTVNGFDFDGSARTLSFFGACRPASETTQVAVSYQYWVDAVKDPNGGIACEDDPKYDPTEPDHCSGPLLGCNESGTQCVCKPNCGDVCGSGARCDMTACVCKPILN